MGAVDPSRLFTYIDITVTKFKTTKPALTRVKLALCLSETRK